MSDGEWHKFGLYFNFATKNYKLFFDDATIVDWTATGDCTADYGEPITIKFGDIDAEEETNALREYDDFKVYNGFPSATMTGVTIN